MWGKAEAVDGGVLVLLLEDVGSARSGVVPSMQTSSPTCCGDSRGSPSRGGVTMFSLSLWLSSALMPSLCGGISGPPTCWRSTDVVFSLAGEAESERRN